MRNKRIFATLDPEREAKLLELQEHLAANGLCLTLPELVRMAIDRLLRLHITLHIDEDENDILE